MVNQKTIKRIQQKILNSKKIPIGRTKHFSFLIRRNKIVSIGCNDYNKTHPLADKIGYPGKAIHSELDCIVSCGNIEDTTMINVRINHEGKFIMSKPCRYCQKLLGMYNITKVLYSTEKGFKCMTISN